MLGKVRRRRSHGTLSPHHLGSVHRHAVPYSTRRELRRYNVPGRERAALAAWGRWVRRVRLALRTLGAQGTLPAQGLAGAPDMTFFIHCALRVLIRRVADLAAALPVEKRVSCWAGETSSLFDHPEIIVTLGSNGNSRPYFWLEPMFFASC